MYKQNALQSIKSQTVFLKRKWSSFNFK